VIEDAFSENEMRPVFQNREDIEPASGHPIVQLSD
jgi:hypothetical protein